MKIILVVNTHDKTMIELRHGKYLWAVVHEDMIHNIGNDRQESHLLMKALSEGPVECSITIDNL